MPLNRGTRLGPYEILAPLGAGPSTRLRTPHGADAGHRLGLESRSLGAGGMGEVYGRGHAAEA